MECWQVGTRDKEAVCTDILPLPLPNSLRTQLTLYCPEDETYNYPKTVREWWQSFHSSQPASASILKLFLLKFSYDILSFILLQKTNKTKWTTTKTKNLYFSCQWRCKCFGKKVASNLTQLWVPGSSVGGGEIYLCFHVFLTGQLPLGLCVLSGWTRHCPPHLTVSV